MFHGDMTVNCERAAAAFEEAGKSSDAVLSQAVPRDVSEELHCRLEGPADTGDAGVTHEQAVEVDGDRVDVESDGEPDLHGFS